MPDTKWLRNGYVLFILLIKDFVIPGSKISSKVPSKWNMSFSNSSKDTLKQKATLNTPCKSSTNVTKEPMYTPISVCSPAKMDDIQLFLNRRSNKKSSASKHVLQRPKEIEQSSKKANIGKLIAFLYV